MPLETVSPATLGVGLDDEGIEVRYLDGRTTVYRGPFEPSEPPLRTAPGRLVQILLVEPSETEGVLVYVNDRDTDAEILEETGVGRINLDPGGAAAVLPGVTVEMDGYHAVVDVDGSAIDGRLFVFAEGPLDARAYELDEAAG
ncbi:MAG: DUF5796 family protein [Halobacteriota archaeon]